MNVEQLKPLPLKRDGSGSMYGDRVMRHQVDADKETMERLKARKAAKKSRSKSPKKTRKSSSKPAEECPAFQWQKRSSLTKKKKRSSSSSQPEEDDNNDQVIEVSYPFDVLERSYAKHASFLSETPYRCATAQKKQDREIACAALFERGLDLLYVPPSLQADRVLVIVACSADGMALEHASEALRNDKQVVFLACRSNPDALRFASQQLQNDAAFVALACEEPAQEEEAHPATPSLPSVDDEDTLLFEDDTLSRELQKETELALEAYSSLLADCWHGVQPVVSSC